MFLSHPLPLNINWNSWSTGGYSILLGNRVHGSCATGFVLMDVNSI